MVVSYDWTRVVLEAKKVVESSITDMQKEHRQAIFKRLKTLLRKAERGGWSQEKLIDIIVQDY